MLYLFALMLARFVFAFIFALHVLSGGTSNTSTLHFRPLSFPPSCLLALQAKQEEEARRAAEEAKRKEEARLKREQEAAQRRYLMWGRQALCVLARAVRQGQLALSF